jgi:DNA invertase Pin-like site-specific DNA recombinase
MVANGKRRRNRASVAENVFTAYLRVSTREQAESHAGLDAQETAIRLYALTHELNIAHWRVDPGYSAKDLGRPAMQAALDDVRTGATRGIIIAKLDRLSRSVIDFAGLMKEALYHDWNIVSVDLGVDLRTPNGKLVAGIMTLIAEWERDIIGERTKDGLAAKREQGVRLGRPRLASDDLLGTVIEMYQQLGSFAATAREANRLALPTVQGGAQWYPATIRAMVLSQDGLALAQEMETA